MISRSLIRRLKRLETRLGTNRRWVQQRIQFVEPGGTVVSTLLFNEGGRDEWLDQEGRPCANPRSANQIDDRRE